MHSVERVPYSSFGCRAKPGQASDTFNLFGSFQPRATRAGGELGTRGKEIGVTPVSLKHGRSLLFDTRRESAIDGFPGCHVASDRDGETPYDCGSEGHGFEPRKPPSLSSLAVSRIFL